MGTTESEETRGESIKIFCCYAREDTQLLNELKSRLIPLRRRRLIDFRYDGDISGGEEWESRIKEDISSAQIILLLVSPAFIASEYINNVEVEHAIERHKSKQARVIPIILRACSWEEEPFGKFQALPKNGTPITNLPNLDNALHDVVEGIRKAINELREQNPSPVQTGNNKNSNVLPAPKDKQKAEVLPVLSSETKSILPIIDDREQETIVKIDMGRPSPLDSPSPKLPEILSKPAPALYAESQTELTSSRTPIAALPVQPGTILQRVRRERQKKAVAARILLGVLVLCLILGSLGTILYFHLRFTSSVKPAICAICIHQASNGESLGISQGGFAFDTRRPGSSFMLQAAQTFQAGNTGMALTLWNQAVQADTGDSGNAEARIYIEDQNVLDSGDPYIDIVVATMLTGNLAAVTVGRDNLQGAYVAQKYFNDGNLLPNGVKVRLLIANSGCQYAGCDTDYPMPVAQQIALLKQKDSHFVGVMGWPFSAPAITALKTLKDAHIPIVSQTASSDTLTGISTTFFRVAPPNSIQGQVDAQYAEKALHATRVALFVDPGNSYSMTLAKDFSDQLAKDGNVIVATEQYTIGKPDNFPHQLLDAESHTPNLIYFPGYAADASVLLTDLPTSGPFANLQVMGSNGLYEQGAYQPSSFAAGWRLHFTSDAHPDEWSALCVAGQTFACNQPRFFSEYRASFDPNHKYNRGIYGYERPSGDVIMSYDATLSILTAAQRMLTDSKTSLTPADLLQGLKQLQGAQAVQGVSGQISFDSQGNPTNKELVIVKISLQGFLQIDSMTGCFQVGTC